MTPSQQAKSMGLKSLTQVSQITGVSLNTLTNWHRDKPELFKTVLIGSACQLGIGLSEENKRLRDAIIKTLNDNLHLADGDNCTLLELKRSVDF